MARVPQVTRTIQTTKATVLCLNVKEGSPYQETVTLSGVYKDDKHVLKQVRKIIENDEVKAVHIVSTEVEETLYGMTEQEFIQYAKILPPRKQYNSDTETDNT